MNKRVYALALAIPVAVLALAACGSSASTSSSLPGHDMSKMSGDDSMTGGLHNAADITFAQEMIPHHQQAVEMAELAATRASSSQVKTLAAQIEAAQSPEIKKMTGWLEAWDATVPAAHDSMAMSHSPMGGMMSASDMAALQSAKGAEFDQMFLTMMLEHHEGALDMARTVKADGTSLETTKLADAIINGQTAEITLMNKYLAKK